MNNNFVLLGDSLTFGYGVSKQDSWAYKLSLNCNYTIINKGINGDTTISMLDRFYTDVLLNNPKKLFIMGGTNDLLCGKTVSSIIENFSLMLTDIKKNKIETIIGIPPYIMKEKANILFMPSSYYSYCENNLPILRNALIALCNENNLSFIDLYSLTKNNINKNIFIDGIHLNKLGNELILNEFLRLANI